jgi:hypothetical protein
MNVNCLSTIKQEEFQNEDNFDEYLYDSNLTVPDMIKQV